LVNPPLIILIQNMTPKKKTKIPPTILVDTREKTPWCFKRAFSDGKIAGVFLDTIDAGDYTLKEAPSLVRIERKKTVGELYGNFIPNESKERFIRELEKLAPIKYKYIIVEQTWDALYNPENFKWAKRNKYFAGTIVLQTIISLMNKYNVHVIFAGDYAENTALALLLKHWNEYDS